MFRLCSRRGFSAIPGTKPHEKMRRSSFLNSFVSSLDKSEYFGLCFSTSSGNESALRVPLGMMFNSHRTYLFTAEKNIRNFEWGTDEAEDFFEDISENDQDIELNLITLMKQAVTTDGKDEKGRLIGKNSNVYDVHDGQQRLVTGSLFQAAIRDVLLERLQRADEDSSVVSNSSYKSPISKLDLKESLKDVSDMIYPPKKRMPPICRIELRESSGNKWLRSILSRTDPDTRKPLHHKTDPITEIKFQDMRSVLPNQVKAKKLGLIECERLILEVYNYFRGKIEKLENRKILKLIDRFSEDVYVLLCVPEDIRIARCLVMGQGKGKDIEVVDFLKGIVCFSNNDEVTVQDATLECWNKLSKELIGNVMEDACLFLAQRYTKKQTRRNGEISSVEQFFREKTAPSSGKTKPPNGGETIFKSEIEPAARALDAFREGNFDVDEIKGMEPPSLAFLRAATCITTCKEIELVILDLVLKYRTTTDWNRKQTISTKLKRLESIALWMMVAKPKPKARFQRCLDIIEDFNAATLTTEEDTQICDVLTNHHFGTSTERKKASAILDRLNEHVLVTNYKNRLNPMAAGRSIEHILPEKHDKVKGWNEIWSETDATNWKQKLGNSALLDGSSNSRIGNKCFEDKKERLRNSPYPLTKDIADNDQWDAAAVENNHRKLIELAKVVWGLDSKQ